MGFAWTLCPTMGILQMLIIFTQKHMMISALYKIVEYLSGSSNDISSVKENILVFTNMTCY